MQHNFITIILFILFRSTLQDDPRIKSYSTINGPVDYIPPKDLDISEIGENKSVVGVFTDSNVKKFKTADAIKNEINYYNQLKQDRKSTISSHNQQNKNRENKDYSSRNLRVRWPISLIILGKKLKGIIYKI